MNLVDYQRLALRTEKPLPTVFARLEHAGLGLVTETGEIATQVKRIAIYGKSLLSMDKNLTLREHIAEEIGDTFWYVAIASDAIGVDVFRDFLGSMRPGQVTLTNAVFRINSAVGKLTGMLETASGYSDRDDLEAANFAVVVSYLSRILQPLVDISDILGIPLTEICQSNIDKLRARFPDAYSNEAAEARADKGGADARNS